LNQGILIIASSARMLAQAAQRIGLQPLVIDLFADLDTLAAAVGYQQVRELTISQLAPAIDNLLSRYTVTELLYGSGLEQHPDSLYYLQSRFTVLGNNADTFARVQHKSEFFALLDSLNIPHPETRFTPPKSPDNWLIKPKQGQGGIGIQRYSSDSRTNEAVYWQKYQTGSLHSVLFLADGKHINIVGFNTQWTNQEFLFSGIINHCPIPETNKTKIIAWLKELTKIFKLHGLNSLDFIYHQNQTYVLEINARIPASMQLYDEKLLLSHIQNKLNTIKQQGYTAYQIIYAKQTLHIPNNIIWQKNCVDIPRSGQVCQIGQPICGIIEQDLDAKKLLNKRHS
jgi:uncharacterized protein